MDRTLYQYNPKHCRYEPVVKRKGDALRKAIVFLSISFITASVVFYFYAQNSDSFTELWLKNRNAILKKEFALLERRTDNAYRKLKEIAEKDDNNYRVILDTPPLSSSIREGGTGGSVKLNLSGAENDPLIYYSYKRIDKLRRQVDIETQSFAEVERLLDEKIKMWASRPAIQPLDNRQLDQLHLTYGLRMHPIFKTFKDHKGLDFSAPRGTPIYATGDGTVVKAHFSGSYGNVIYINHGHGFETRYAHMSKLAVKKGDFVKRGQVIGKVGNTGNSVSSHLHYEVLVNGKNVNPINFFQRDLSNDEYEKLVQLGTVNTVPLD